jgi:hypothetical protein
MSGPRGLLLGGLMKARREVLDSEAHEKKREQMAGEWVSETSFP